MPPKKPPTEDDYALRVRQDGKAGKILIDRNYYECNRNLVDNMALPLIKFQEFKRWPCANGDLYIFGYCPLFEAVPNDTIPTYKMRITMEDPEPLIEMFKQE